MNRNRLFFRIIVGGYLAYLGMGLVRDTLQKKPDNYILFAIVGVLFIFIGLMWLGRAALKLMRNEYDEGDDIEQENADYEADDQITEVNSKSSDGDSNMLENVSEKDCKPSEESGK